MAAETGFVLPAYAEPLIAVAAALIAATAARFGWVKAKNTEPEAHVEMAGAVVDSRAVKTLIDAIDHAVDRVTDLHDMRVRHDKRILDDNDDLREDIKELTRAIRALVQKEIPHA